MKCPRCDSHETWCCLYSNTGLNWHCSHCGHGWSVPMQESTWDNTSGEPDDTDNYWSISDRQTKADVISGGRRYRRFRAAPDEREKRQEATDEMP